MRITVEEETVDPEAMVEVVHGERTIAVDIRSGDTRELQQMTRHMVRRFMKKHRGDPLEKDGVPVDVVDQLETLEGYAFEVVLGIVAVAVRDEFRAGGV